VIHDVLFSGAVVDAVGPDPKYIKPFVDIEQVVYDVLLQTNVPPKFIE
jgi:hypothetical protein